LKAESLSRALELARGNTPVVLVRELATARAWLVTRDRIEAGEASMPPEVLAAARAALARDGARTLEADGHRYLLQTLAPPLRLVVIGAVHIAQRLVPLAKIVGFEVTLVDPRPAFATAERFPGVEIINGWPQEVMPTLALNSRTAVVTLSHDAKIDEPALAAALASEAFYIGALGSRGNHEKRLARLRRLGFGEQALARIAAPVGLPLGGRAPAEIAIAILAEMIQSRYKNAEG